MNTVRERPYEPAHTGAADYFVLSTRDASWHLSAAMAQVVEARLLDASPESWVTFVDLTGARVRLRAGLVQYLAQCYAENRAEERRIWAGLRREAKEDRNWGDE